MPVYSMMNKETNEEFEVNMSNSDRELYLEENPHIIQVFRRFPGYCDPVRVGIRKTDSEFRDVLSKAKNAHKHSTIEY